MPISQENNSSFATNIAKVSSTFFSYYAAIGLVAIPAQPFISTCLRLSNKKAVEGATYEQTLRGIWSLPFNKKMEIMGAGYHKRMNGAIPVNAAISAVGDIFHINPFVQAVGASLIETTLNRNVDPREMFKLVNVGASAEEIAKRAEIAARNRLTYLSVLCTRGVLYSASIHASPQITASIMEKYGEELCEVSNASPEVVKNVVRNLVRIGCIFASVPINKIYAGLASGNYESLADAFSKFKPAEALRGGGARIAALYLTSSSIGEGRILGAYIQKRLPDFSKIAAITPNGEKISDERAEKLAPGIVAAAEKLADDSMLILPSQVRDYFDDKPSEAPKPQQKMTSSLDSNSKNSQQGN